MDPRRSSDDRLRLRNIVSFTLHIGHARAGLLTNQPTCRDIPGMERHLPESVKAAGGYITEIERRGAKPAHSLGEFAKFHKVGKVVLRSIPGIIGKSGDKQAPL